MSRRRQSITDGLGQQETVRLDISSLVDVVFLLLLFFIVSSRIAEDEVLRIQLPAAGSGQVSQEIPLEINITGDNTLLFGGERIAFEQLPTYLEQMHAERPEQAITVRADGESRHASVIRVYDEARKAGFRRLNIAVKRQ